MTREQMIDLAVKKSMKRSTMQSVLNADYLIHSDKFVNRLSNAAFEKFKKAVLLRGWNPKNFESRIRLDGPFYSFPRRLGAIRYNFQQLKNWLEMENI